MLSHFNFPLINDYYVKALIYCYHLVNFIAFSPSLSDHIKWILLSLQNKFLQIEFDRERVMYKIDKAEEFSKISSNKFCCTRFPRYSRGCVPEIRGFPRFLTCIQSRRRLTRATCTVTRTSCLVVLQTCICFGG